MASATKPKSPVPLSVSTPFTLMVPMFCAAIWESMKRSVMPVMPLMVKFAIVRSSVKSVRSSGRAVVPAKMLLWSMPPRVILPMSPGVWTVEFFRKPATVSAARGVTPDSSIFASKSPRGPPFAPVIVSLSSESASMVSSPPATSSHSMAVSEAMGCWLSKL